MDLVDHALEFAIVVSGFFGPPAVLARAWYLRTRISEKSIPGNWRRALRDVALIGATLLWIAFWAVLFLAPTISHHEEWGAVKVWMRWIPISFYCSAFFAFLASLGKGKGRVLTILFCVFLVFGLIVIDAWR